MAYQYLFKTIVIGESGVGKSALLLYFTDRRFTPVHDITIGVEFGSKIVQLPSRQRRATAVKLQIWDTAGQEAFRSITRAYYQGAALALVVYDATRRHTFDKVTNWIEEARANYARHQDGQSSLPLLIVVGNKADCQQAVSTEEGQALAAQHQALFIETSAKTGHNVDEAFQAPARLLMQKILDGQISQNKSGIRVGEMLHMTPRPYPENDHQGCCALL